MQKFVIGALGALVLVGSSAAAVAGDSMAADDSSALSSATRALTGNSVDSGWDALTPQETATAVAKEDKRNTIDLKFTPFVRYEDVGDLEDDLGNVEVDRYGMALRMDLIDEAGNLWAFRFGWEESDYDVSDSPTTAAEDALDDATVWSLSLVHQRRIDEKWSAFGGFGMQFGGASGVAFSDGRNFMGAVGGIYDVDEKLSVGLGIIVKEDFDDSTEFLPLPMLTYKVDDRTLIRWRGPRADVVRRIDERFSLRGFIAYERRQYRLDDDVPGAPDGSVDDTHVLVGIGMDFSANEWLLFSGEIGLITAQEYEIQNSRGSEIDTIDGDDTGLFLGLSATLLF